MDDITTFWTNFVIFFDLVHCCDFRNVLKVGAIRDELKQYEKKLQYMFDFQKYLHLFLENARNGSKDLVEWGEQELNRSGEQAESFIRKVMDAGKKQLESIEDMNCRYRSLVEALQDGE